MTVLLASDVRPAVARRSRCSNRLGLSPLEVLITLALVVLLFATLTPAFRYGLERSRRVTCENNIKQLGLAVLNYEQQHGRLPAAYQHFADTRLNQVIAHNWGVAILPFMEQQALYSGYDWRAAPFQADAGGGQNIGVISTVISYLRCSESPAENQYRGELPRSVLLPGSTGVLQWTSATSDYCVVSGVRGAFAEAAYAGQPGGDRHGLMRPWVIIDGVTRSRPVNLNQLSDGAAYTALLGERTGGGGLYHYRLPWEASAKTYAARAATNGGGWGDPLNGEHWLAGWPRHRTRVDPPAGGECAINCTNLRGYGFHSFHPHGASFLTADGAVHFLHADIAPAPMAALLTADKQELSDAPF